MFEYMYTRINVARLRQCKEFYKDVLGLKVVFEDEADGYVEFDAGPIRICLFDKKNLKNFLPKADDMSFDSHSAKVVLSFRVKNLDEAIDHLKSHQVELMVPATSHSDRGFASTCFRDPDGNLIEVEQLTDLSIS